MMYLTVLSVCVVVGLFLFKLYLKFTTALCKSKAQLNGKTAIVTGANTGIGFATAMDFARRKARVILGCRNETKGKEAVLKIISETGNKDVVLKPLDLSSLSSVRKFAKEIIEEESHLEILVNNAGVFGLPKLMTEDGLERTWATNHLGPFLLTNLLLDLLKKSAPSRIVNVSSYVHKYGVIDVDDLQNQRNFKWFRVYADTKLANVMFTRELAKQLAGTGVIANSVRPGPVKTEIFRQYPIFPFIGAPFMKTAEEGAQTTIHCAVSEEVEGISGKYFSDCAMLNPTQSAFDDEVSKKLWEESSKLVGLK